MPKSEIHPKWYPDAKVICNGEVVMTTGSTQPELHVDVWSGNHPLHTSTCNSGCVEPVVITTSPLQITFASGYHFGCISDFGMI